MSGTAVSQGSEGKKNSIKPTTILFVAFIAASLVFVYYMALVRPKQLYNKAIENAKQHYQTEVLDKIENIAKGYFPDAKLETQDVYVQEDYEYSRKEYTLYYRVYIYSEDVDQYYTEDVDSEAATKLCKMLKEMNHQIFRTIDQDYTYYPQGLDIAIAYDYYDSTPDTYSTHHHYDCMNDLLKIDGNEIHTLYADQDTTESTEDVSEESSSNENKSSSSSSKKKKSGSSSKKNSSSTYTYKYKYSDYEEFYEDNYDDYESLDDAEDAYDELYGD